MSQVIDYGTKLSKTGTGATTAALTTSYTAGSTAQELNVGKTEDLILWVAVTGALATNMTAVVVKLQTSYDGTNWTDVVTDNLDGSSHAVDQSLTATASTTLYYAIGAQNQRLLNHARVVAKATAGGALAAADAVVVKAVAR